MSRGNVENNLDGAMGLSKDSIYLSKELKESKLLLANERTLHLQTKKDFQMLKEEQDKLLNEYKLLENKIEKSLLMVSKNEAKIENLNSSLSQAKELLETKKDVEKKLKDLEKKLKDLEKVHEKLKIEHTKLANNYQKLTNNIFVKLLLKFQTLLKRLKGVFKA